jgi:hypothetical protein
VGSFRRNLTHLLKAYPPEQGDYKIPDQFLPVLVFNEPLLGSALWETGSSLIVTGANGQNPVDAAVKPGQVANGQDAVWYIQSIKVQHDDPTARNLTIKIAPDGVNFLAVSPTYVAVPTSSYVGPDRAFWLPTGGIIRVVANGLAAGNKLIIECMYGGFPLGITPPTV